MAGFNGRKLTFDWNSTTLVGVRTRGMTMNNEIVDVTTDDDDGWQTLLATPGKKSVEVSISGVSSDEVLIAEYFTDPDSVTGETLEATLPTTLANAGSISGTFLLSSLEVSGEHDGEYDFSATFMSSGAVTYTASSA